MNGDLGVTFKDEAEDEADIYAQDALIPKDKYKIFISKNRTFDENNIVEFANEIERDPGIVLGRLMNDGMVRHENTDLSKKLRHKYVVRI